MSQDFRIVGFSTEDNTGVSLPTLYVVPITQNLPDFVEKALSKNFFRCTYESENETLGARLNDWLNRNCKKLILNNFVVVVNQPVEERSQNLLPKFKLEN